MIADAAFMAVLCLAALLSVIAMRHARPAARAYLQFAAVLYLALSIAGEAAIFVPNASISLFADTVRLVVCALGPVALSLSLFAAFEHPPKSWIAAVVLTLSCFAAIGAAISGESALAFAPLSASVFVMLALSLRRWRLDKRGPLHAIIASLCFLAAAASGASGGASTRTALALFSAAGLLGMSLALARRLRPLVAEESGKDLRFAAIGGQR